MLTADPSLARCCAPSGWGHVKPETPVWSALRGWVPAFPINTPGARAPTHSPSDAWGSCSLLGEGQRWAAQGWFGVRPGPRGRVSCFLLYSHSCGAQPGGLPVPRAALGRRVCVRRGQEGAPRSGHRTSREDTAATLPCRRRTEARRRWRPAWVSGRAWLEPSPPLRLGGTRTGAAAGPCVSPVGPVACAPPPQNQADLLPTASHRQLRAWGLQRRRPDA